MRYAFFVALAALSSCSPSDTKSICGANVADSLLNPETAEFVDLSPSTQMAYLEAFHESVVSTLGGSNAALNRVGAGPRETSWVLEERSGILKLANKTMKSEADSLTATDKFFTLRVRAEGADGDRWTELRECKVSGSKCSCGWFTGKKR